MEPETKPEDLEKFESPPVRIIDGAKDIFGALDGDTLHKLESSIENEGCRDRLIVWPQPEDAKENDSAPPPNEGENANVSSDQDTEAMAEHGWAAKDEILASWVSP